MMEKRLLRNWLLLNRNSCKKQGRIILALSLCLYILPVISQVNKVGNPGFETKIDCSINAFQLYKATYWNSIDSTKIGCGGFYYNSCSTNPTTKTPSNTYSFQYPRSGNAYIMSQMYCLSPSCSGPYYRMYPKNRLLTNLTAGTVYCAKMYVNLVNTCQYGIDAIQMYFGDSSLDTITTCGGSITYLNPQVSNSIGNVIGDTLNWIEISGTFTATGNEKYLVIGCFKPDAAVTNTVANSTYPMWAGYNIDDVSVIDYNLPAYAGPDKNINLGDSAFIGRPPEIGLDCTWTTGTVTVGDSAGIWVKPTSTGTFSYVVTQNICGNIKTDTVNVNISSGINENTAFANSISTFPQPAKDILNIGLSNYYDSTVQMKIIDVNGKEILNKEFSVPNNKTILSTENLSNGVYILQIISKNQITQKRLIIAK